MVAGGDKVEIKDCTITGGGDSASSELCPFYTATIQCEQRELGTCPYIHGDTCDMCLYPCLHPTDVKQQEAHRKVCYFCNHPLTNIVYFCLKLVQGLSQY